MLLMHVEKSLNCHDAPGRNSYCQVWTTTRVALDVHMTRIGQFLIWTDYLYLL